MAILFTQHFDNGTFYVTHFKEARNAENPQFYSLCLVKTCYKIYFNKILIAKVP